MSISWQDFEKLQIRVGTVVKALDLPKARKPAYILHIDFGKEVGIKKSSTRITDMYKKEDLIGTQIMAVTNFSAKKIGSIEFECLVVGFYNKDDKVILAVPDKPVHNGARLV